MLDLGMALNVVIMLVAWVAWWRVPDIRSWSFVQVLRITILMALLTEVLGIVLAHTIGRNAFMYNVSTLVEFLLVLWLVGRYRPEWRVRVFVAAIMGTFGFVCNFWFNDPFEFLMSEAVLLYAFILCTLILMVLWHMANTSVRSLHRVPEFWVFMGLLVFYGGLMPIVALIRFIFYDDEQLATQLYRVITVLIFVRYSMFTAAGILARHNVGAHGHG